MAAGGGGGSSGTAGGNGDSLGGTNSNDSSKNGIDGVNGSGGSSALDSTVCTEFVTQGGGCKERETTPYSCCTNWVTDRICATGETECGDTFCDGYTQGSTASSECYKKCGETLTGTTCKETTTCASYGTCYDYGACTEYYPTKEVCNKTDTIYGTSGNGGKNIYKLVVNNKETKIEFKIGSNSGNGYLKISYIGETI